MSCCGLGAYVETEMRRLPTPGSGDRQPIADAYIDDRGAIEEATGRALRRRRGSTMTNGAFSMKQLTSRRALLLCATMFAGLSASPMFAETAAAAPAGASSDSGSASVGEIVVT